MCHGHWARHSALGIGLWVYAPAGPPGGGHGPGGEDPTYEILDILRERARRAYEVLEELRRRPVVILAHSGRRP